MITDEAGLHVVHHGGNTLGFSADMYFLPERDLGVVVLTNLYAASNFVLAVREKIFELMFGAEAKAERTIAAMARLIAEGVELLHKKVSTDPASMGWVDQLVGRYRCAELGSAEITKREGGFWIQFEEWGGLLGAEIQPGGDRLLRLVSPPWRGTLKMLVDTENSTLSLDGGQHNTSSCRKWKPQRPKAAASDVAGVTLTRPCGFDCARFVRSHPVLLPDPAYTEA
jgi:hypothetical protein